MTEIPEKYQKISIEFDRMYELDQEVRIKLKKLMEVGKGNSEEANSIRNAGRKQDLLNQKRVASIINQYGWLGSHEIGEKANQALFLIIQHASLEVQEKYFPAMRDAVGVGKARKSDFALLVDRMAYRQGMDQLYGTQLYLDEQGESFFYPIKDVEHVNARRLTAGLAPIEEYAEQVGIDWDLLAMKEVWGQKRTDLRASYEAYQLISAGTGKNVTLAFQKCKNIQGRYTEVVADKLRDHPLLCLKYGLETGYCQGLEYLSIEYLDRQVIEIPPQIAICGNLREMSIYGGKIEKIPDEVTQLPRLEALTLYDNQLLPTEVVFQITTLKKLTITKSDGQLLLPDYVGNLTNLELLRLDECHISKIPPELGNLKNLKQLSLKGNYIEAFPKEIRGLSRLSILDISGNDLSNPDALTQVFNNLVNLKNLENLWAKGCQMVCFPERMPDMNNLSIAYFNGNLINEISKSVVEELLAHPRLLLFDLSNNLLSDLDKKDIKLARQAYQSNLGKSVFCLQLD